MVTGNRALRQLGLWSGLVGWGWSVSALAGAMLVLGDGAASRDAAVVIATALVAFGVGVWAGAVGEDDTLPFRDRWQAAAALLAVAAAFGTFAALYEGVFPGIHWQVAGLVFGVAVPAYALGLIPPVLVEWYERLRSQVEEESISELPAGVVAVGVLAGAAAGMLIAGFFLSPTTSLASLTMASALALLAPLLVRDVVADSGRESVIFETVSPFGSLRVTEIAFPGERQPERRLYLNGEEESGELVRSGAPTLAYVAAAEQWLSAATPTGADYLFLGGGAYTLPRRIAERDPTARISVVELDPEVTRIAHRFFGLTPHHAIQSIHGDARAYLDASIAEYNRVYVDVYDGREVLPYSLVTREAAARMGEILKPGGIVAMNLIGTLQGDAIRQVWSIIRTFDEVFPSLALYTHLGPDFPDAQNLLLAASMESDQLFPPVAGMFERWPRQAWPTPDGVTVFRDVDQVVRDVSVRGAPQTMRR